MTDDEKKAQEQVDALKKVMLEMCDTYRQKIMHSPAFSRGAQLEGYRRGIADAFAFILKGGSTSAEG